MIIGTHPDDEVLMAGGRTRAALNAGDDVKVVVVTNGDAAGMDVGLAREAEAVASAQLLGLPEQDVIFMGYPDGSLKAIHDNPSDTAVITSGAGLQATYGNRGLGGMDFHRLLFGVPGPYSKATARADFEALLAMFQPDEIYTHGEWESHPDHEATALFVAEALSSLKRSGSPLRTKLYQGLVWMPGDSWPWPMIGNGWTPDVPFLPDSSPCTPGACLDLTQVDWEHAFHFPQPPEMQVLDQATNLKAQAVPQGFDWYTSFVRKDELFWLKDFGLNLATTATVTASSEDAGAGLGAEQAVDGVLQGAPWEQGYEWATLGELAGAWIQLSWPAPVRVAQVNLWDRPGGSDNVQAGTLLFSDGSQVSVGALPTGGKVMPVVFAPRTISWVRFRVDQAVGSAVGLSEIEVLGAPAASTADVPPSIVAGPLPLSRTIPASQTTTISVQANDTDGDPLSYTWSAEGGAVVGSGATVVYTPPVVSSSTWFAVSVTVSDGRGGSATNTTHVQVTPAPASTVAVSPALLFGGDPATGTIALGAAAPAGGSVVTLTSSLPSLVAVPASVTVPGGALTATFGVSTAAVTATTPVVISAGFSGGPRSTTISLVPASVASLVLASTGVLGGLATQGTVTIPAPAGPSGVVVQLSSSDPATVTVPASLAISAGATTATFPVSTGAVSSATAVTLTATYGGSVTTTLTVSPLSLSSFTFTPNPVVGGNAAQGTVTLNGPAPVGGAVVALGSVDPATAAVPATVTIPPGSLTASFTVGTVAVASSTPVAVTASYGASTISGTLTVTDQVVQPPNANLVSNPEQIGGAGWDVWGDLTVTLNAATAPDGSSHATRAVSGGLGHALRFLAVGLTPSTTYTFSFFARNNGGSGASYSVYDDTHGQDIVAPTPYLAQLGAGTFTRVIVTFVTPAGCTAVGVYPLRDSGAPADLLLWGAKLELGPVATGYQNLGVESLAIAPSGVVSGGTAVGTLTLSSAAPAGGVTVALSSGSAAVSVPATVIVPAGATGATFAVTANLVASATTVTVTATFPGGPKTAAVTVTPLGLSALSVSPATVVGGAGATGTVTLGGPAPTGGAVVALSSDDPAVAVPASVTVAGGATSASFAVASTPVDPGVTAHLSATLAASVVAATVTVQAPRVATLAVSPTAVVGGGTATGTVTLTGAAPFGGVSVGLSSSSAAVAVPGTVTVPGGASAATFAVTASAVASATSVTLTASYGTSATATLALQPLTLSALTLAPTSVAGGSSVTGTVTLSAAAPAGGLSVALASANPAVAGVPPTATVAAGATTATFPVTTSPVPTSTTVAISATANGTTRSANLTVTSVALSALSVSPASVRGGSATATGTVTLSAAAPAGGIVVSLSSSAPAASVPAAVTVAAGATTGTFTVTTVPVTASTAVTLTAVAAGSTRTASLTVTPFTVAGLAVSPSSILGGASSTGTVTLVAAAPAGGLVVSLGSSNPAVTVPATVTVAAGATAATFLVSTSAVSSTTGVTLTATYGGSVTATLTVSPPSLSSVTFTPNPVVGGNAAQGTVSLNGPAPVGGALVALGSADPARAAVPATVTIPAGSLTASFTVGTVAVASTAGVAVTAAYGASTTTGTLTVADQVVQPPNANLISNPEQIGGAGWDVWGDLAVTLNAATAPDSSSHATRAVSGGLGHALRYLAVGLTPNTTYTFSFFARNNGGTAASYSVYDDTHGRNIFAPTPYLAELGAGTFTRVTVTFVTPSGCTAVGVYPLRDSGAPANILLWGTKLELGPLATGY